MFKYYKVQDGFYKKVGYIRPLFISLICTVVLTTALFLGSSIKSNKLRTDCDRLREQLITATDTNTRLGEELRDCQSTISQCRFITEELDNSVGRSISSAREAIEIIEEIRYEVGCLEMELGIVDSDSIYDRIDNWLQNEGVVYDGYISKPNNEE